MNIEILTTGDEVLLGDIADTNAAFLCRSMNEIGFSVKKITAVRDRIDELVTEIERISRECDICIVTGGLGPTKDDVTAQACAAACKKELVLNPDAITSMKPYFQRRGFELSKINEKQALIPRTAQVLQNDKGTAPGFYMDHHQCRLFFLPGVPREMKTMFQRKVKPVLIQAFGDNVTVRIKRITVFGLGESKIAELLKDLENRYPDIRAGFRVDFPLVEVKLVTRLIHDKADSILMDCVQWAKQILGKKVVSDIGLSMAQEVGRLLKYHEKTLAAAESCTGGLISSMMTDVSGSSDYFLFSGVTYSNEAKMSVLGVKEQTLFQHGAVHEQTAMEMAQGARRKANADFAVSTTGIAGPTGGTKDKPVGMVCIGIADEKGVQAKTCCYTIKDRLQNKQMFAATALEQLRQRLVLL